MNHKIRVKINENAALVSFISRQALPCFIATVSEGMRVYTADMKNKPGTRGQASNGVHEQYADKYVYQ